MQTSLPCEICSPQSISHQNDLCFEKQRIGCSRLGSRSDNFPEQEPLRRVESMALAAFPGQWATRVARHGSFRAQERHWLQSSTVVEASLARSCGHRRLCGGTVALCTCAVKPLARPVSWPGVASRRAFATTTTSSLEVTQRLTDPSSFLNGVDVFIFDCDGVIWHGDSLINGVPAVLDSLRRIGKRFFFVTNNSTKSRAGFKGKFTSLGLNVNPEESTCVRTEPVVLLAIL